MDKAGRLGMAVHQAASFSPPLMGMTASRAVFWPGCALMSLDPAILERTLAVLRREEKDMGLSACCCGQPTRYLEPERYEKRREKLRRLLERRGVERVYTACPNCGVQLRELGGVQVISLWPVLEQRLRPEDLSPAPARSCVVHDPCPTRREKADQEAVRALLALAGAAVAEPAHCRERTICCGNYHMTHTLEPEKSAAMRRRRAAEFPAGLPVVSCCEGCLGAFQGEGLPTLHLLEMLFGPSSHRGWGNRLAFTRNLRKAVSP